MLAEDRIVTQILRGAALIAWVMFVWARSDNRGNPCQCLFHLLDSLWRLPTASEWGGWGVTHPPRRPIMGSVSILYLFFLARC